MSNHLIRQATTTRKRLPKDSRYCHLSPQTNVNPGLRQPSLDFIPSKLKCTAINSINLNRANIWVSYLIESYCNKIMIEYAKY